MSQRESLPGLKRTIILLEHLAPKDTGMGFNEIRELFPDAPASTISRLLKTLLDDGLIEKKEEERNYRIGHRARRLGRILCGKVDRSELLRPVVRGLAEASGHSAAYFELIDDKNTLVVKHEIPEAYHYMQEGKSNTSFSSHGCAKVLMAYQSDNAFADICSKYNIIPQQKYVEEMRAIKRDGVHINYKDDRDFYIRIAAPVFAEDEFAGAIGITVLGQHSNEEYIELAEQVKKAAKIASDKLSIN